MPRATAPGAKFASSRARPGAEAADTAGPAYETAPDARTASAPTTVNSKRRSFIVRFLQGNAPAERRFALSLP
jgi:hypothetical protein